jgi:hypothetical protein
LRGVTKKMAAMLLFLTTDCPDFADDCRGGRAGCLVEMQTARFPPWEKLRRLWLLFLAEFLEGGIAAQRIPERIESKKCRRDGPWAVKPATVWRL